MGKALEAVGDVTSTLLGAKPPKMPKIEAPTPMPAPDDDAATAARRRAVAAAQRRSGVQSTLLSGSGQRETLGG